MSATTPRIAVLGCGYWGRNLVRTFHSLGVLHRVCDAASAGRDQAELLAPGVPKGTCLDDALTPDIDAVVIATPAETHFSLVEAALLADKHVFVEKPMALRLEEATDLCALAAARGRILMVGHVLEYHPAIECLRDMLLRRELGDLQYVYSNRLNLGKVRREENILWSFAPHDVAVILRLVGAMPTHVTCSGGAYVQSNIADVTVTNLEFASGVRAHIFVSWLHPFKEQRLVLVGSRAMASFDDVAKKLVLYDRRVEMHDREPVSVQGVGTPIEFSQEEPLRRECAAFVEAVNSGEPPLTDGDSGMRTLQVLSAAQRSLQHNGQAIDLDPESLVLE